jgi:hypothetical protein
MPQVDLKLPEDIEDCRTHTPKSQDVPEQTLYHPSHPEGDHHVGYARVQICVGILLSDPESSMK